MIVVDTSALMAVILGESGAEACAEVLEAEGELLISAGTFAEALIVAARRNVAEELERLVEGLAADIVPLTAAGAMLVASAYETWGRGQSTALNFGDCFAYALAKERNCGLLFVGADFSRTDIASAL